MSFNVAQFLSVIGEKELQRPSKFQVRLHMPAGMFQTAVSQAHMNTVRYLEYYAESVGIPNFGLQTARVMRYGYGAPEARPFGPNFMDCQVNFVSDGKGDNFQFFYDWVNLIYNTRMKDGINGVTGESNRSGLTDTAVIKYQPYELSYRIEYMTDIEIQTFNMVGEQVQAIVLREAFPVAMGGQELNWLDVNSYVRLPVTFAYTDLYMADLVDPSGPAQQPQSLPALK